ncbi:DNA repair protein RecN [Ligilactobacillus hohenheimensis]|uniref:DNA repair protein RecN n=1 Tax=Ligilactobacillus hohenheimensis TaxID=2991832 RepID=UPI0024BAF3F5|nr:DNA repair protein RecN [Ligilactobacillus hohenheimensis]
MLQELEIHDFAIIEQLNVTFHDQMTVLTGETGAGKSIIIDALGLLAGGRGRSEFIRKGASKAVLRGLFVVPTNATAVQELTDRGIPVSDGEILLERDLTRTGRNVCRVNGTLVNLATLRAVGERLIDIHGQNEHQELMRPETHLGLLDEYARETRQLREQYQAAYKDYEQQQRALNQRKKDEQAWAQRLDMLDFQVKEIEAAHLKPGEEEELAAEKERLVNYQAIHDALEHSYQLLNGQADVLGNLGTAMDELEQVAQYSDRLTQISEAVNAAFYSLQDVERDIADERDDSAWDEDRLDEIEQRLDVIHQLKRKYGDSVSAILEYYEKIKRELATMQEGDADLQSLEQDVQAAKEKATGLADQLTAAREKAARRLEQAVHAELAALYMDKVVFEVRFRKDGLTPSGQDGVEFYVQTNPGEEMGPLAKIASGGELSRIMLALKTIFAHRKNVTSIIFDEVDTGVSGRVAQAIAEKIHQIATNSQVLCITHLPQVASIAQHHYYIEKAVHAGRTTTHLTVLNDTQRVDEIARMLAGSTVTPLTQEHAREMLAATQKEK